MTRDILYFSLYIFLNFVFHWTCRIHGQSAEYSRKPTQQLKELFLILGSLPYQKQLAHLIIFCLPNPQITVSLVQRRALICHSHQEPVLLLHQPTIFVALTTTYKTHPPVVLLPLSLPLTLSPTNPIAQTILLTFYFHLLKLLLECKLQKTILPLPCC